MSEIEYRKQLDDLVCDEINVKNLARTLGITDRGELTINYNREAREYTWNHAGETLKATPVLYKILCQK